MNPVTSGARHGTRRHKNTHDARRSIPGAGRAWSRIGPRLLGAVMVPIVALSVVGLVGVLQRHRDSSALSRVVTQVRKVVQDLELYAGLVDERSGSESTAVAAALHYSAGEAGKIIGYDIATVLRTGRREVDAALANGGNTILGEKAAQLVALRTRIDAGLASEREVRPFFVSSIAVAESAWSADVAQLTEGSLDTAGSPELRRAVASLTDSVDAFIAGADVTIAAAALEIPGVPDKATALTDVAAANALYARAAARLRTELRGQAAATQQRVIVTDDAAQTFQKFVHSLIATSSRPSTSIDLSELARPFGAGLLFVAHLGQVVRAAAAEIAPLAHRLEAGAQRALELYLLVLGVIAALSAAVAIVTARRIVRPLGRLAARATKVSSGSIDDDAIAPDGPYEVAMVTAAFNEVVANLSALDASALALASGDLDNFALTTPVPGRIGDSLRHSVDRLHTSVRTNEELRRTLTLSETRFHELADRSPDIVLHVSREPELHIDYVSPSFEALTGIPGATVEADFSVFADALDSSTRAILANASVRDAVPPRFDATFRRADGTSAVFEVSIVESSDGIQGVARDVTEVRALQARLAEQATRDPLTGLANRRLLDELLGRAVLRSERSGHTLTVAFLDLDKFKCVNDTYGHDAGDAVLRATATRLRTAVREADVVARYGGDEFIVVYEGTDTNTADQLTQRIADALDPPVDIGDGVSVRCEPSIGIADTRTSGLNPAALIQAADRAMLKIKVAKKSVQAI
jgi:diguanylate cyclase (GGDEF)-like protein